MARENGGEAGFHSILVRMYKNGRMHASLASASIVDGQPVEVGPALVARAGTAEPLDVARDVAEMAEMLGIVMAGPDGPANYRTRAQMEAKLAELEAEHAAIVHDDSAVVRALNATYANRIAGLRYALGEDTLPSAAKGITQ